MTDYVGGDHEAFERLLEVLEPKIRRCIRRHLGDESSADDVFQQVLLRVHLSRRRYVEHPPSLEDAVERWFMATTRRAVFDHLRREYRRIGRVERLTEHDSAAFGAPLAPPTPEQQLRLQEDAIRLRMGLDAALGELSWEAAEVVRRHKLEEQPIPQIAADVGVAASTLRVRAHRAYRKLAQHLAVAMAQPG